jgi:hypothetical protein
MIAFMKQLNVFALNAKEVKDHLPMDPQQEAVQWRYYANYWMVSDLPIIRTQMLTTIGSKTIMAFATDGWHDHARESADYASPLRHYLASQWRGPSGVRCPRSEHRPHGRRLHQLPG